MPLEEPCIEIVYYFPGLDALDSPGGCSSRTPALMANRRPIPAPLAKLQRDIGLLLDASDEARNNATRGESEFLRVNLKAVFELAEQIRRRRKGKRMRQLLSTTTEKGARL